MANQSKLKAWVRYDGTNTVVTGGPIFQANKPKVGNWRQINADLCCNPSGSSSTTTTTTIAAGPTTWSSYLIYVNQSDACSGNTGYGPYTFYTAGSTLEVGTTVWADAALTVPFTAAVFAGRPWVATSYASNAYLLNFNGSTVTISNIGNC